MGGEARAQGVAVVLGPGINIKRSPLCGRNFEYVSEDPYLAGRVAAGLVEGLQSEGVGACVKHFAVNNQETDRLRVSAEVDERTLREIYLPAFEHVITTARPWTVMCAYNKVNGTYASQHRWLLTEVLRDEWGFDGLVMSDWGAVADRVAALAAGLDLEMPPHLGVSDRAIVDAVADGSLPEEVLDTAVARVLQLVERARAGARPPTWPTTSTTPSPAGRRRPAWCCCATTVRAPPARTRAGSPSSGRSPPRRATRARAARRSTPPGSTRRWTRWSRRCPTRRSTSPPGSGSTTRRTTPRSPSEAVRVAAGADVVVAYLGLPAIGRVRGLRPHPHRPAAGPDRPAGPARRRRRAGRRRARQRLGGAHPARGSSTRPRCSSAGCGGQAVGGAIADVLTGAADPSGRLAETIPLRLEDSPSYLNFPGEEGHVRYGEGVFVGYRGFDAAGREVAYPFGHGLSYTTFAYRDLDARVSGTDVTVEVTVVNTGERAGREVVQLYVGDPQAAVARPPRELKGFAALDLAAREDRRVSFTLNARDLSYWSTAERGWLLEGGEFTIEVGASSRDIALATTVSVGEPRPRPPLTAQASLDEWLADPDGAARLRDVAGAAPILGDAELRRVIGNFPLGRLAAFPAMGITDEVLHRLNLT